MTTNTPHSATEPHLFNDHTPAPELALSQHVELSINKESKESKGSANPLAQEPLDMGKNLCDFWSHSKRSRGSYFIENIESILKNKNN